MMTVVEKELLNKLPLFHGLPEDELLGLEQCITIQDAPAGVLLFSEGDRVDYFSILIEGEVEIVRALGTSDERLLGVVGAGDYLGEMSIFLPNPVRLASARTLSFTRSLLLTVEDFIKLIRRRPELAVRLLEELTRRISNNEAVTVRSLEEKNRRLTQALHELRQAQAQLIEKEKLEHELTLARRIQENSLPKTLPEIPGWSLAAYWQPAHQVGGDLYDVTYQPPDTLKLLVADVTGKGVPAALVMATTRSVLHALITQVESPGQVLCTANELLVDETPWNMFVTCFLAVVHLPTGRVQFANAGQNLPYKLTPAGLEKLAARGMPLGLFPGAEYVEAEAQIAPGEGLLLYSDGLVEVHNREREMFGGVGLERVLAGLPPDRPPGDAVLAALHDFVGPGWEQEDDITLVSLLRAADTIPS